ncbi:MAG: hypothetical protein FD137_1626 [Spirochaetes bacterium]|nr:MAG: hypothetical protein FD137_1626 [Spirochaetota bacterium]
MANPFSYRPSRNRLTSMASWSKAIFLICVSLAAMQFPLMPLTALFLGGLLLHWIMGIDFRGSGKVLAFILYLTTFSALARGLFPGESAFFDPSTLPYSLTHGLRLMTALFYARLYYASTKASELGDVFSSLARKVAGEPKGGRYAAFRFASDPGMLISLSLAFLPKTFESMERVRESARMRAYRPRIFAMKKSALMLETFVFVGVKSALSTATCLETRGYSENRTIILPRAKPGDFLIVAAGLGIAVLAFV